MCFWGADAEAGFTFAPELNRTSERLLEDSAQLPANFFERQRFFHDLKLRRLRVLQSEVPPSPARGLFEAASQIASMTCSDSLQRLAFRILTLHAAQICVCKDPAACTECVTVNYIVVYTRVLRSE